MHYLIALSTLLVTTALQAQTVYRIQDNQIIIRKNSSQFKVRSGDFLTPKESPLLKVVRETENFVLAELVEGQIFVGQELEHFEDKILSKELARTPSPTPMIEREAPESDPYIRDIEAPPSTERRRGEGRSARIRAPGNSIEGHLYLGQFRQTSEEQGLDTTTENVRGVGAHYLIGRSQRSLFGLGFRYLMGSIDLNLSSGFEGFDLTDFKTTRLDFYGSIRYFLTESLYAQGELGLTRFSWSEEGDFKASVRSLGANFYGGVGYQHKMTSHVSLLLQGGIHYIHFFSSKITIAGHASSSDESYKQYGLLGSVGLGINF